MFSKDIVQSDAFLDMPASTQALYFQLGMEADDDGFVGNPKRILRVLNGGDDDMKLLMAKKFVLVFDSGVLVVKHHRINNKWDSYNCKRTLHMDEFSKLYIKENMAYTLDSSKGELVQTVTRLQPVFRIEENRREYTRLPSAKRGNLTSKQKEVQLTGKKKGMSKIRAYDENNPGDYERTVDADTGEPTRIPTGRTSKRNVPAQRVAHHYTLKAEQYIGKGKLGPMGYFQARKILDEGILDEQQLLSMVDDFFNNAPNEKDALNPYVAFSLQRAREYKLEL